MSGKITPSLEDYLETIYDLSKVGQRARVTDVAAALSIAKSSVHLAVHALKDQGYVVQEHYGQITLTEEGEKAAKIIRFKHDSLKAFLVTVLKVDEQTAENEACKIEHAMSLSTVEKIVELTRKLTSETDRGVVGE